MEPFFWRKKMICGFVNKSTQGHICKADIGKYIEAYFIDRKNNGWGFWVWKMKT